MNIEFPKEILWAIVGFVAVKVFDFVAGLWQAKTALKDDTVKKLEVSLDENSDALRNLKFAISSLEKSVAPIPRLEKDVTEAHTKIRELKASLKMADKDGAP